MITNKPSKNSNYEIMANSNKIATATICDTHHDLDVVLSTIYHLTLMTTLCHVFLLTPHFVTGLKNDVKRLKIVYPKICGYRHISVGQCTSIQIQVCKKPMLDAIGSTYYQPTQINGVQEP